MGWAMFLDYLVLPLISAIIPALAIQKLLPWAPFPILTFLIIALMTMLNLGGIRATVRANALLLIASSAVVILFLVLGARYLFDEQGWAGIFSLSPVYNPSTFKSSTILGGISLATITYIGFDGLTTLAEDSVNPKRDMILSTVLTVLITGILSAIELFFLHQVVPDWRSSNPETSYLDAAKLVGGTGMFVALSVIICVSQFGSGFSFQVSAARLLYGMGRDNVLPRSIFGYLSQRSGNPSWNIVFIGILAYLGTVFVPFDAACDLINFGAYFGFMGVNAATIFSYYVHPAENHRRNLVLDALLPGFGFLLCLVFWLGLPNLSKLVGGCWLLVGVIYCAFKTGGFRYQPLLFDFDEKLADGE
jgi:amino acid transporter